MRACVHGTHAQGLHTRCATCVRVCTVHTHRVYTRAGFRQRVDTARVGVKVVFVAYFVAPQLGITTQETATTAQEVILESGIMQGGWRRSQYAAVS